MSQPGITIAPHIGTKGGFEMKVTAYRTSKYGKTDTHEVDKILAMPGPDSITEEDIKYADGIMLCLCLKNGETIFLPHSFLISIEE